MIVRSGTSKGNQIKKYEEGYFVKYDTPGWYESISEVLVSELQMHVVNALPYVDYTFLLDGDVLACKCKSFLADGESTVSLYDLLKRSGYNIDFSGDGEYLRDTICGILKMDYSLDIYDYLSYMIYLDAIILNEDRHLRNISFIKSNHSLRQSPIYDNGLSLLSAKNFYHNGIGDISTIKSQPFSNSFDEQVMLFNNPHILIRYEDLLDRLSFAEKHPECYVPDKEMGNLLRAIRILKYQLVKTEGILWFKN